MFNIKWVESANTNKTYVCAVCHYNVEYKEKYFDNSEVFGWTCQGCYKEYDDYDLHLEIQD